MSTYNRVIPSVQYPACVGAFIGRVEGARVRSATLESDWEDVPLTVVGWTIVDDLKWGQQEMNVHISTYNTTCKLHVHVHVHVYHMYKYYTCIVEPLNSGHH